MDATVNSFMALWSLGSGFIISSHSAISINRYDGAETCRNEHCGKKNMASLNTKVVFLIPDLSPHGAQSAHAAPHLQMLWMIEFSRRASEQSLPSLETHKSGNLSWKNRTEIQLLTFWRNLDNAVRFKGFFFGVRLRTTVHNQEGWSAQTRFLLMQNQIFWMSVADTHRQN